MKQAIGERAKALGFDLCRVVSADEHGQTSDRLRDWIAAGYHGSMEWMAETAERRAAPRDLWPGANSIIMLGMNYGPDTDPLATLAMRDRGAISVYARARDYHDVIKGKLKQLAGEVVAVAGSGEVKVFVDTAPVMEKPLAQAAGLGWQGKHSVLVSRDFGNWLFLGSIFTTLDLPSDPPEIDHCGTCRRCLDICPTDAFPQPYVVDSRRCIAYLTIEYKGHIPIQFRRPIGNRIYGCDDCLAVCPWNKFASSSNEMKLVARPDLVAPALAELAALDDRTFRQLFTGSPIKRIGRDRFIRNVMIAIGNSGEAALRESAVANLTDASELVRAMSVWAVGQLCGESDIAALADLHFDAETDEAVRLEWQAALYEAEPDIRA